MKMQRFLAAALCLALALPANAQALKEAFDGLMGGTNVTATSPGRFNGNTRNGYTGGSFDLRFPKPSGPATLISIDPPRYPAAGCGGISAHFGGFSFVNGDQIEKMIENIGE